MRKKNEQIPAELLAASWNHRFIDESPHNKEETVDPEHKNKK